MTKEQLEGNKLIAHFMNEYHDFWWERDPFNEMRKAKYHEDWNELIRVVEKIESFDNGRYCFFIVQNECDIALDDEYDEKGDLLDAPNFSSKCKSKIESVWLSTVEFIKWYNENNDGK